ncbi:MAG: 16S rRNA (adenine(1518)-N(6)/adenine(1519)-N(6))-dimethyltransferase RsmA [Thermoanaerobaculia bacterium]
MQQRSRAGLRAAAAPRRPARRKALGQHHLKSGASCRPALEFLAAAGRRVLEIGPGGGVLTRELVAAGASPIWGLEIDLAWTALAARGLGGAPVAWVVGDAVAFDYTRLPAETLVAGNLPYNVAAPIVARVLLAHGRVPRAAFLLQREVVDRITAAPGGEAYGALTLLVGFRARARRLAVLRPGAFVPPPKVESAFVGLELHPPPLPESEMPALEGVVRAAFGQRRKTLRNALGAVHGRERAAAALATAGLDPDSRAEVLGAEDFLALHAALAR